MDSTSTKTISRDEQEQEPAPIHGDILETILSHVPLIHLIPASHVSKSWTNTISSTLRTSTNTKPWLTLHTQHHRHPHRTTTHAYAPDSNSWIQIHSPPLNHVSTLRSSHSNLLYIISSSNLSSFDPLHLTWHHALPPKVSRIDPVVAVVGTHVVVAGGAFDFENDPVAVEVYDLEVQKWTKSDPMPEFFNQSNSSTWLSVASDGNYNLFVMEKSSGVTYSFDTSDNKWSGPYDLRPDNRVFYAVIGLCDVGMIVVGMLGEAEDVEGIKIWEVNCYSSECKEIGTMPGKFVEDLKRGDSVISSIDVVMAGNMVYMCVCSRAEVVVVCEFVEGRCRWRSVATTEGICGSFMDKVVLTCSKVGMEELQRAMRVENWRFVVKR